MTKTQLLTPTDLGGLVVRKPTEVSQFFNMMIYGEQGTGKTTLAASASVVEALSPVLLIDVEGGTQSLVGLYEDISVVEAKSWQSLVKLHRVLERGNHPYKTVIIDNMSEAQKLSMAAIMVDVVAKAKDEGEDRDPDVPSVREWGKLLVQMERMTRHFRDLPMNVIFTAWVDEDKNKEGVKERRPGFQGKFAAEVAGYVDLVLYLYVKELKDNPEPSRLLLTKKTSKIYAKDRRRKFPQIIEEPTMQMLYNYLHGKTDTPTEETASLSTLTDGE